MTLVDKILLCIHPVILVALNEISPPKDIPIVPSLLDQVNMMAIILISMLDITLDQVVGNHLLHWHLLTGRISHALTLHRCGQRAGFAP